MALLKHATTYNRVFLMVESTTHLLGKTGVTVNVFLSKNGGALAAAAGSVTGLPGGLYSIALTSADTDTQGDLAFHCTGTNADPTNFIDQVIAINLADGTRLGMVVLPNAASSASGGLPTAGTGTNQISLTSGNVTLAGGTHAGAIIPVVVEVKALTANNDKTGYSLASGTQLGVIIPTVVTTKNLTTNNDKTGYALSSSQTFDVTGNITGNLSGSVGSVTGAVGSVTGNVDGNVTGSVGSVLASVTAGTNADKGVRLGIGYTVGTNNAKTGYSLAAGQLFVKKNTALGNFMFLMLDSSDHVTPKTGLTVTGEVSIDGAAFGALTNSASEIGNGIYKIDLAAADVNGTNIMLKFTATGADQRNILIVTQT